MQLPEFLTEVPYGDIRLAGSRISLYFVATMHWEGKSADEILEEFPTLAADHVRKVIGFIDANQDEVERFVAEWDRDAERNERLYSRPEKWAELRRRYAEKFPGQKPTPLKD
jgi:uncharacterized protein (DUF433 family)